MASISGIDYKPAEAARGIADSPDMKLVISLFQNLPESIVENAEALLCRPALDPHPFGEEGIGPVGSTKSLLSQIEYPGLVIHPESRVPH